MILLLAGAALALAADTTPVEPAWVLVDRDTPLRLAPSDDAPTLHVAPPSGAPPHRTPPVLVLLRTGRVAGFVQVRVARQPMSEDADHRPAAPDVAPPTWPHCYPQAPAIAALDAGFWVRDTDVLPVLTRSVTVHASDGRVIAELSPGLAVSGPSTDRLVQGHHLSVVAPIPDSDVGDSYPLGLPPPPATAFVGVDARGSFVLQDGFRPRIDTTHDEPVIAGLTGEGRTVTAIRDRCIDVRLPPTSGVLARDPSSKRKAAWPMLVPQGSAFGPRGQAPLGKVGESASVLWSTDGCTWTDAEGLCCTNLGGLTLQGASDPALCFDVDLPTAHVDGSLARVLGARDEELTRRSAAAASVRGDLSWTIDHVQGSVGAEPVLEALQVEGGKLQICYDRALTEDPWLQGDLTVRFPVAPDGRSRTPTTTHSTIRNDRLEDCVRRRLSALVVADQIGQVATIVDLTLSFRTSAKAPDEAP